MIELEEVINKSGLHPSRVINIYLFGSQIYKTSVEKSDYDILIIAKTVSPETEIVVDNLNIHILTYDRFMEGLKQFNMRNIECIFSPSILKEDIKIPFEIKIDSLRHSISHTVSNSWVKSMKKITQGDYYIGIKSLFHSMRIAMFGTQLIQYGNIIDWGCANYIWEDLISKPWTWVELDSKYKPLRNKLMTEFRLITSK